MFADVNVPKSKNKNNGDKGNFDLNDNSSKILGNGNYVGPNKKSQSPPTYSFLDDLITAGFYSDDPIDLVNSVLSIPSSSAAPEGSANADVLHKDDPEDPFSFQQQQHLRRFADLTEREPMSTMMPRIIVAMSGVDATILASLLGRPGSLFETTPHRFCQAVVSIYYSSIQPQYTTVCNR